MLIINNTTDNQYNLQYSENLLELKKMIKLICRVFVDHLTASNAFFGDDGKNIFNKTGIHYE